MTERSAVVDIAKGIGIILVVLGHLGSPSGACYIPISYAVVLFHFGLAFQGILFFGKRTFCSKTSKNSFDSIRVFLCYFYGVLKAVFIYPIFERLFGSSALIKKVL